MDYKLEALHKVYKWFRGLIILAFALLILISVSSLTLAIMFDGSTMVAIFGCLWGITFIAVWLLICFSSVDTFIPRKVYKSEEEYQQALEKAEDEKQTAKRWEEIKAKAMEALQRERDGKIDYLVSHIDEIKKIIEKPTPCWISSPDERPITYRESALPKPTALDKKLEPKKN